MNETIGYLYVNGLGDGRPKLHERLMAWWWRRKGIDVQRANVNWFDGKDLDSTKAELKARVETMLQTFGAVVMLASSAGGSLTLNTFAELDDPRVFAILGHARLKVGDYANSDRASLYHRAHMDTDRPSPLFEQSVTQAEALAEKLSEAQKARMLTLSSVSDGVVPPHLMAIEGVQDHRSFAFGHAGGFLAHMIADRDLIIKFVSDQPIAAR